MGYNTTFELTLSRNAPEELINKLEDGYYDIISGVYTRDSNNLKWYNYTKDMAELSNEYPEVLLTLKGSGDDSPDLWVAYYLNGEEYGGEDHGRAQIIVPSFNQVKNCHWTGNKIGKW